MAYRQRQGDWVTASGWETGSSGDTSTPRRRIESEVDPVPLQSGDATGATSDPIEGADYRCDGNERVSGGPDPSLPTAGPASADGSNARRELPSRWTLSGSLVDNRPPGVLAIFMVVAPVIGALFGVTDGGLIQLGSTVTGSSLAGVLSWLGHQLGSLISVGNPALYVASIMVSFAELSRRH